VTLDFDDLSDGELAALTLAGRKQAFATIMARHRSPIHRLVRGHVGDADEALDVTQEAFVAAFVALRRYDAAQPMRPWLARIALNKCRDWGRRRAVRRLFSFAVPLSDPADEVPDCTVPADTIAADRQELEAAWTAIAQLPMPLKEPLILHAIDGLSQAETAQVLGISEKAVETRVARARARLLDILPRG
jgi:RNA polymerase sigma factor (sigma-70 family)